MDRLELEHRGELQVIRMNVQESVGQYFGARYGVRVTPTFIIIGSSGNELWRTVGSLDADRVGESLR